MISQVGINTTTPQAGSMLDITSATKGILIPRVNISDLNTIAPITGGAPESLLVYNTNNTTGRGFHYWNGSVWIPIITPDWKPSGNAGTNPAIDFIGTTDNVSLRFRTNNIERLEITNNGLIRAFSPGTAAQPLLSWDSDSDTGIFRSASDVLNFTAGGQDFLALSGGGINEFIINNDEGVLNTRIATFGDTNTFYVNGLLNNVGLGTNTPDISAQLELAETDKGILINRVALTSTALPAPIVLPATGLLVYNTAYASSGSTEVLPGFYYWDGTRWIAMGGTGGKDWSLEGNAGTNVANNFLGTTDNVSLAFRTDDSERMLIDAAGTIGIGNNPYTDTALRVNNASQPYGVIAQTSSDGIAIYGSDTGTGLGVLGISSNNHGIYGTTAYTGGAFLIGGIIGWGTGTSRANGVLAVSDQQPGSDSNMGIRAVSGSTTSISSNQIMNVGVNTNATDLALYALSEGPITSNGIMEAARFQTNYSGSAIDSDTRDPRAQLAGYTNASQVGGNNMYYGGYFYSGGTSGTSSYAYAGARYGNTNYKIIGNGNVSTIVDGVDGNKKIMFAPEAPEVLFEDYGIGQLSNGAAFIDIDPNFTNNIIVDTDHPLKVFIQLEGDCNGVYVTQKSAEGFMVKELQNGNSNVSFSWHIVANRKDEVGGNSSENSEYADLRFPDAPNAIIVSENKALIASKLDPIIND
ncbi:hypothetical protein KXJ69_11960 [Aureisphaera sp. CAU 1614]|uniref:Uncharacterized protein n=1 Tax=Halomarinibacterium sedimenti TaxID=2857106 RepID=A0A9X1FQT8_9FLAO|nr:hypothetical protein [Halomarinibacterium sedimenti]MBW2938827.1 hypothetical protein [Halomarinibacterium sedimenti]